jgi:hypothetical protein
VKTNAFRDYEREYYQWVTLSEPLIDYKFIIKGQNGAVAWEGGDNRHADLSSVKPGESAVIIDS